MTSRGLGKHRYVRLADGRSAALGGRAASVGHVLLRISQATYRVSERADEHALELVAGVVRVADVLKVLGRVLACLGGQDLVTTRVLGQELGHIVDYISFLFSAYPCRQ